jgi:glycogen(starch) synthase
MRVLFWSELFWPIMGGGSQFSADLAVELRRREHDVLVVTRRDEASQLETDEYRGVSIRRFPFHEALFERRVDDIARWRSLVLGLRRQFEAELVHTTSFGPSMWFEAVTAGADSAPHVVTLFGEEISEAAGLESTLHRALRGAAWVTAPSRATLEYALRLIPECAARSSVIPVGCAVDARHPDPALPGAPLLCIGRLVRAKGFDIALSALSAILERKPDVRLRVAGDGPERGHLVEQATRLGVSHAVEFLGWVPPIRIPLLLAASSMLLVPSRAEALPLVGIQAALAARPVVAAAVGGIPELVIDHETGILVEPDSPEALATAVLDLLERPDLVERLGLAARALGCERFRLDHVVDAYEALYRRIVTREGKVGERS